jgi:hypothetical protein
MNSSEPAAPDLIEAAMELLRWIAEDPPSRGTDWRRAG